MFESDESSPKPRGRWLKYSMRTLMVLVLLISIPLSWVGRDVVRSMRESAVERAIHEAGGEAIYDYWQPDEYGMVGQRVEPTGDWWVRKLLGDNIYSYVTCVDLRGVENPEVLIPRLQHFTRLKYLLLPTTVASESLVETLKQLPDLQQCRLDLSPCSPIILWELAQCQGIEALQLQANELSDSSVDVLLQFPGLKSLTLRETPMTDAAMPKIAKITTLNELVLEDAPEITNDGFQTLESLPHLTRFFASGTQIDEGCVDSLRTMTNLDNLEITPGKLKLAYYPWGLIRLDTRQQVRGKLFPPDGPREDLVRIVHIEEDLISFDPDDLILPEQPSE